MANLTVNFIGDIHFSDKTPTSRKDNYAETIIKKYASIAELYPANYYFLLGDLFQKASYSLKFINEIVRMEKEAQRIDNHETYAVVGNHDCFYASSENLKDTALGNLLASGLVKLLDRVTLMNGLYEFVGWHFDKDLPVVDKEKGKIKILIGHVFYEVSLIPNKDYTLSKEQVMNSNFDVIVLGHDHIKYDPVRIGNTIIYRPGSLSRATGHYSQIQKEITILRMELDGKKAEGKYVTIPSLSPEEVFVNVVRESKSSLLKRDMKSFVRILEASQIKTGDIYSVLDGLEILEEERSYVENLLLSYGIVRGGGTI